jgi:hypothetical protein
VISNFIQAIEQLTVTAFPSLSGSPIDLAIGEIVLKDLLPDEGRPADGGQLQDLDVDQAPSLGARTPARARRGDAMIGPGNRLDRRIREPRMEPRRAHLPWSLALWLHQPR